MTLLERLRSSSGARGLLCVAMISSVFARPSTVALRASGSVLPAFHRHWHLPMAWMSSARTFPLEGEAKCALHLDEGWRGGFRSGTRKLAGPPRNAGYDRLQGRPPGNGFVGRCDDLDYNSRSLLARQLWRGMCRFKVVAWSAAGL